MTLSPETEEALIRAVVGLDSEEFLAAFDRLLDVTGTVLRLRWHGPRDRSRVELWLHYDGKGAILALYEPHWLGMRWCAGVPRVDDFRDRLVKLLQAHEAEIGLGINHREGVARCNIAFPYAPRRHDDDPPLSRRLIYTRRGPGCGEYVKQRDMPAPKATR